MVRIGAKVFSLLNNGDAIDCQNENPKPPRLADPEMGAAAEAILMASDLRNPPSRSTPNYRSLKIE
jgi:hypothetical protein